MTLPACFTEALDVAARNTPFLMSVTRHPDTGDKNPDAMALCYPVTKISDAFCYMLSSGQTIYAEFRRCNDGSGWREVQPGEFDGRVIGRVHSFHLWSDRGHRWISGPNSMMCG